MTKPFPKELQSRLSTILGERYTEVIEAFSHKRDGSFRINTLKWDGTDVFAEFSEKWIITENLSSLSGVYVFDRAHEYAIKGTRAFYDGKIYLQSIASMLPVLVLAPQQWENVLDVCAAPGSKTTQLSALMDNTGSVTAIERNQIRYDKLMHNTRLQWANNAEGIKMDARVFLWNTEGRWEKAESRVEFFDKILLDAPCSAEGRINTENEKSYGFWSIANILDKSELQYELLASAYNNLRSWGTLVYSTCTLAPEENEWVISHFLRQYTDATLESIDIWLCDKPWWKSGIWEFAEEKYADTIQKTVRILPSDETEWFYIAKIRKV